MLLVIEIFLYFSCLIFLLLWECFAVMYINDILLYMCCRCWVIDFYMSYNNVFYWFPNGITWISFRQLLVFMVPMAVLCHSTLPSRTLRHTGMTYCSSASEKNTTDDVVVVDMISIIVPWMRSRISIMEISCSVCMWMYIAYPFIILIYKTIYFIEFKSRNK